MNYRRIPFQFTTTDPVERQRELERRFGLPPSNNMYVDFGNPSSMGTGNRDQPLSSPRLQHRVPIFVEGNDQPIKKTSVDSNMYPEKRSNIRIVPIEVEGANSQPSRHRTFSGPAGLVKENENMLCNDGSAVKRSMQNLSKPSKVKTATEQRIHNIPIQIEGRGFSKNVKSETVVTPSIEDNPQVNGCNVSKPEIKRKSSEKKESEPVYNIPLKKIENVLHELETYECGVQKFNGTVKDKQYRFLDEMLTRCMLRLDDIDTMGNENVRFARKSAVKKVQACINLLESKVNPQTDGIINKIENVADANQLNKDIDMNEVIGNNSEPTEVMHNEVPENECLSNECMQQSSEIEMAKMYKDHIQNKDLCENVEAEIAQMKQIATNENELLPPVINAQLEIAPKDQNMKGKANENEPEKVDLLEVEMTDGQETELLTGDSEITEVQMKEKIAVIPVSSDVTQSQIVDLEDQNTKGKKANENRTLLEKVDVLEIEMADCQETELLPGNSKITEVQMKEKIAAVPVSSDVTQSEIVDKKQNNLKCGPQMKTSDVEMKDIDDDQKEPCLKNPSGDSEEIFKEKAQVLNFGITEKESDKTSHEHSES